MAVLLLFGEDTYSQREKLKFWQKEFAKKYDGDTNITTLQGEDTSAQEIFQTCSSLPFLSEKRFTLVKNFLSEAKDEERSKMADLVEKIPDFCTLAFSEMDEIDKRISLYKRIQKIGKIYEFNAVSGSKLLGWIEKTAEKHGGEIEKEAVIFLAEFVGSDLYKLENEIAKLIGYAGERQVTKKDVELLVDAQFATSIFRLTDGIGQKNRKKALETLHQLIESGEDLHRTLYMVMRQLRIILSVKDLASKGMSQGEITSKLKEHPFVISNTITQARNFSFDQLKRAYELLIIMDTKLKSGGIKILAGDNREFVLAMDRLVIDLCK